MSENQPFQMAYYLAGVPHQIDPIPQAEVDSFYSIIGYVITQWSQVDRQMFECFHAALGVSETKAARLYYSKNTIGSKISLLHDILSETLEGSDLLPKWIAIKDGLNTTIRNLLAHHPVSIETVITNVSDERPDTPIKVEHAIFAHFEEKELLQGRRKNRVVKLDELQTEFERVKKATEDMTAFKAVLKSHLEQDEQASVQNP